MSNSKLVNYIKLSPMKYKGRGGKKIDAIAIHHMAGVLSVETCGNIFQNRQASSNYGIGYDARVGLYVDEADTSWCTSSYAVDSRAVTIELSNSSTGGQWPVSDKVIEKCIELCVDICKRNDIKKLNFTGNSSGNLFMHCWYANTSCPGPYLKTKFKYIADEVNKKLAGETPAPKPVEKLDVDGLFGYLSTKALQKFCKTTQDGEISGQIDSVAKYQPALLSATYEGGGSACIRALQKYLVSKGYNVGSYGYDGQFGHDTVTALQKFLKAKKYDIGKWGADGIFGTDSAKALQRFLNDNVK